MAAQPGIVLLGTQVEDDVFVVSAPARATGCVVADHVESFGEAGLELVEITFLQIVGFEKPSVVIFHREEKTVEVAVILVRGLLGILDNAEVEPVGEG